MDDRKQGLKAGLRQLTVEQLVRLRNYDGDMVLDRWNYQDGCFCPLAIALGLDEIVQEPTHEKVYAILALAGYRINSTWGCEGSFYPDDRYGDLMEAVDEVIAEKEEEEEFRDWQRAATVDIGDAYWDCGV